MATGDYINTLQQQQMQAWGESLGTITPKAWSESVGKLIEAITQAQLEFDAVKKEQTNPFFKSKYADLSNVLGATQKQLAKYGIFVAQFPIRKDGSAGVRTVLFHKSGEWIDFGELLMPLAKQDAQGVGSGITYSRRYSYQSAVGVSAEEDDDGNAAVSGNGKSVKHYEELADQREAAAQLSIGQVNAILKACKDGGKTEKQLGEYIKAKHGQERLEGLTGPQFQATLKWARSNGDTEETLKASVRAAKKAKEPEGMPLTWDKQTTITDEDVPF